MIPLRRIARVVTSHTFGGLELIEGEEFPVVSEVDDRIVIMWMDRKLTAEGEYKISMAEMSKDHFVIRDES